MKTTILNITIISSIIFSVNAVAGTWHNSTVRSIYPFADGNFIITFQDDSQQCTSTNSPHYYKVVIGENSVTTDGAIKMYSALLTAAAAGKSVDIYFDENSSNCYINRIRVFF